MLVSFGGERARGRGFLMNLSVPREPQPEEAVVGAAGSGKSNVWLPCDSSMVMEVASAMNFAFGESRSIAKLTHFNDLGVERDEENVESADNNACDASIGMSGSGLIEVTPPGDGSIGKEEQVQQPLYLTVREERDLYLHRDGSGGNGCRDAVRDSCGSEKELLLVRVNVKAEEQLKKGSNSEVLKQKLVDSNHAEGNSESLRKKSPEGKVDVKDVAIDVNQEEPREEKRSERTEDVLPLAVEKENGTAEKDVEQIEKENDRSCDKEKEAVKRQRGEKERDRDLHRRDEVLVDNGEGKAVEVEDVDMVKKPVDERKLKEGRERVRDRHKDKEREDDGKRKKRGRDQEKERDFVEGEMDKDAVLSNRVQQRKRMLRPRGQSNPSHRDNPRSRSRLNDNEGQDRGNKEILSINYRAGEGMQELARLWKEYCESGEKKNLVSGSGPTIEIRIPAELATTANRKIRVSHLWGTDIYTDDSDIVAVLFHTGYCTPQASLPPSSILELRATIRIFESQRMYMSSLRNTVRSRSWASGSGCSYSVERCRIMKQGGGIVELEPCSTRTLPLFPTLAPAASERTVTTRAASSSAHRQQRFLQEVTIQYNLCNEPWLKYNISIVADRGLKKSQFTSARLKEREVIYVETSAARYELAYDGERATLNRATAATSPLPQSISGVEKVKDKNGSIERALDAAEKVATLRTYSGDKAHGKHPHNGQVGGHLQPHESYRWSKCKRPLPISSMKTKGVPLPEEFVEVLEEGLTWEEVQWSPTGVWVRGVEYILNIAQFFAPDDFEE